MENASSGGSQKATRPGWCWHMTRFEGLTVWRSGVQQRVVLAFPDAMSDGTFYAIDVARLPRALKKWLTWRRQCKTLNKTVRVQ